MLLLLLTEFSEGEPAVTMMARVRQETRAIDESSQERKECAVSEVDKFRVRSSPDFTSPKKRGVRCLYSSLEDPCSFNSAFTALDDLRTVSSFLFIRSSIDVALLSRMGGVEQEQISNNRGRDCPEIIGSPSVRRRYNGWRLPVISHQVST